jgi:hypothetical protein
MDTAPPPPYTSEVSKDGAEAVGHEEDVVDSICPFADIVVTFRRGETDATISRRTLERLFGVHWLLFNITKLECYALSDHTRGHIICLQFYTGFDMTQLAAGTDIGLAHGKDNDLANMVLHHNNTASFELADIPFLLQKQLLLNWYNWTEGRIITFAEAISHLHVHALSTSVTRITSCGCHTGFCELLERNADILPNCISLVSENTYDCDDWGSITREVRRKLGRNNTWVNGLTIRRVLDDCAHDDVVSLRVHRDPACSESTTLEDLRRGQADYTHE